MAITFYHPEWGAERPISGLLFDLDGLVLDTEKLYTRFWREACGCFGFSMSLDQALSMRSQARQAGSQRLREYFGPSADYDAIRAKRIALMDAYMAAFGPEPKPGIYQLLDALEERGIPAAITSASPPERIEEYLKPLGLWHRFRNICSAYQVSRGKPAPDIYLYGAAQLGLDPSRCLALEDSPTGIESAWRAGCLPVLIPDQDDTSEEFSHMLYAKADSLENVIQLLYRQGNPPL